MSQNNFDNKNLKSEEHGLVFRSTVFVPLTYKIFMPYIQDAKFSEFTVQILHPPKNVLLHAIYYPASSRYISV